MIASRQVGHGITMNLTSLLDVLACLMPQRYGRGFLSAEKRGPGSNITNADY